MTSPTPNTDLIEVQSAIRALIDARLYLRRAGLRRASILASQALKAAQGAEKALLEQLNFNIEPNGG